MPSLSLLSLNHLHLPKCIRALLNGDDLDFCGVDRDIHDDQNDGRRRHRNDDGDNDHAASASATARGLGADDPPSRSIGSAVVSLVKPPGAILGLTVVGGVDKGVTPHVAALRPGAAASKCDVVCEGDVIVSINGETTANRRHEEIIDLLRRSGDELTMEIEYPLPPLKGRERDSSATLAKTLQVRLQREPSTSSYPITSRFQATSQCGFGFVIRGGAASPQFTSQRRPRDDLTRPLTVVDVRRGGKLPLQYNILIIHF